MPPKFHLVVCEIFFQELNKAVKSLEAPDVEVWSRSANCDCGFSEPGPLEKIYTDASNDAHFIIIGAHCVKKLQNDLSSPFVSVKRFDQCFHLVTGPQMVDYYQSHGSYLVTPGWLNNWRENFERWGFSDELIVHFFGESAKDVLLLDTGIIEGIEHNLNELSEKVGLPSSSVPVGLDYCKLIIKGIISDHRNSREIERLTSQANQALREKADHGMAMDLLSDMAQITIESDVIQKVIELFTMLFAPIAITYWPIREGRIERPVSWGRDNAKKDPPEELIDKCVGQKGFLDNQGGFSVKIAHLGETVAFVRLESIGFPDYIEHYLNLAVSVSEVLGLSIDNARKYEEISRVQEELQRNEERYREIFHKHPAPKLLLDPYSGAIVDANLAAAFFYGYELNKLKGMNLSDLDSIHAGRLLNQIREAQPTTSGSFSYRHKLKSGEVRDVEAWSGPVRVQDKELIYSIIQDVTERLRIESALKESEQAFRLAFEGAKDAIIWMDAASGQVIKCNQAAEDLFNRNRALILSQKLSQLMDIEDQLVTGLNPEESTGFRRFKNEFTQIIPHPERDKYVNISVSQTNVGNRAIFQLIARDITSLKNSEMNLSQALELNEKILASSYAGIAAYNSKGELVFVNKAMSSTLGVDDKIMGAINFWKDEPWKSSGLLEDADKVLKDGVQIQRELVIKSKQDREIWLECGISSFHIETDPHFLILANDISDRKNLDRKREILLEEMQNFTYIVSHDLKGPLVNLKGFSRELKTALESVTPLMEKALEGLDKHEASKFRASFYRDVPEALDFIESSIKRLQRMTSAILHLAKLGGRALKYETINMEKLIGEIIHSNAHQIIENRVKVSVGKLPEVVADRISMEQIMGNLIVNAIKYAKPGEENILNITGSKNQKETTFFVEDKGVGISKKYTNQIFEIFQRVGANNVDGEGMGLAHVRTLVRRHNGEIGCESELGKGSMFYFSIPNLTRAKN